MIFLHLEKSLVNSLRGCLFIKSLNPVSKDSVKALYSVISKVEVCLVGMEAVLLVLAAITYVITCHKT